MIMILTEEFSCLSSLDSSTICSYSTLYLLVCSMYCKCDSKIIYVLSHQAVSSTRNFAQLVLHRGLTTKHEDIQRTFQERVHERRSNWS